MHPPRAPSLTATTVLRGALALVLLAPSGLSAQPKGVVPSDATAIPMPPPVPPERPAELNPVPAAPAPEAPARPIADAPPPPERPADLSGPAPTPAEPAAPPLPPARPAELSGTPPLAITVAAPDDMACRLRLERLGAGFEPVPAIANGPCGAAKPLRLSTLAGGLALTPPATLVCGAAEALARWASEVQVAAERDLGQPLKSLAIGTSYECRGQNHDPDAKLSEHSYANGIDVMGFGFAGRPSIAVAPMPEGSPEAAFLGGVRAKACGFFRTVLGPGSDPAHANHFHLDERERAAGHRLCQ